jgi:hypothetical protein
MMAYLDEEDMKYRKEQCKKWNEGWIKNVIDNTNKTKEQFQTWESTGKIAVDKIESFIIELNQLLN